ncbi:MAG: NAD(P)H-binding protein [Gammaproteobacteria bacterium]|nr:NAD(P)H-binding protein [Gammaproteobacteria bacterium]
MIYARYILRVTLGLILSIQSGLNLVYASEDKNIVVFGASGRIGEVVVIEALERGYKVKGVSRKPEKLVFEDQNFTSVKGDLKDIVSIRDAINNSDAVVISVSARAPDNKPENSMLVEFTRNLIEVVSAMENKPYIVQVGGANLMYGATYEEVKSNMHNAPFSYEKGTAMHAVLFGHQISVELYRASGLPWTVIAPPMRILGIYGELDRSTSRPSFRISDTEALVAEDGSKTVYVRDLARALVNEIEEKQFSGKIFNVAY